MSILRVENLTVSFGGLNAVDDVSFETLEGEILSIVGPNGAGKTTLFNAITKFIRPTKGKIYFDNEEITNKKTHEISKAGIIRTFQKQSYFPSLTLLENVLMGQHLVLEPSFKNIFAKNCSKADTRSACGRAIKIMEMLGLDDDPNTIAKMLPYGKQRLLGIAIALASEPKLLMLDEPCAGSNPFETQCMTEAIKKINKSGIPIILVEHHMKAVMELSARVIVLNSGELMAEGSPLEIQSNESVIEAYLGKRRDF